MKKAAGLLFLMLWDAVAWGQAVPNWIPAPLTRLEQLIAKKGAVIAVESYYLPGITGENACNVRLQALVVFEENAEAFKARGIKVEIQSDKKDSSVISYIDIEELDGLSKALASMMSLLRKGTALPNPVAKDVSFTTNGGLMVTMSQHETDRELVMTQLYAASGACIVKRDSSIMELKTSIDKALQSFRSEN